jgi:hypothetical protein
VTLGVADYFLLETAMDTSPNTPIAIAPPVEKDLSVKRYIRTARQPGSGQ